jgi:hypothetical protein
MSSPTIIPEQVNLSLDNSDKTEFHFYDSTAKSIHKVIEIDKNSKKVKVYPFYYDSDKGVITLKKIEFIEFDGWTILDDIPRDFRKKYGTTIYYDFQTPRAKQVLKYVQSHFKTSQRIVVSLHGATSFTNDTLTFNWLELLSIFKSITSTKTRTSRYLKFNNASMLHKLNAALPQPTLEAQPNELSWFVNQFTSLQKFSATDIKVITKLITDLPSSKITVTNNFIQTQNKINIVLLSSILKEFETLRKVSTDNEKDWQTFFATNAWLLNHLFPFDVILKHKEAYVGGKTIENAEGRVVDFLFDNGFKDNYALLEIKTHKKGLLKNTPYRGTEVFAMTDDLSGGINQALDQKQAFIAEYGNRDTVFDPKCILVIGMKSKLSAEQRKCFELIRSNQKSVDIVTFDELEEKLRGLLKVLS